MTMPREPSRIRFVLDRLVWIALWAAVVVVAGVMGWFAISHRLERRRSIARVRECVARAPGIPDEERARLIAEVPRRFKEAEARERAKCRKGLRPSDDELWKDAWESQMRACGEDELVDELSGQWSTEKELEALLKKRHSTRA